ncbi:MAG: hypothetical protein ACXVZP_02925 [Gaiellaceae bacterium]
MRRLILVAAGSLMLTVTGLALARGLDSVKSVTSVAGTFTATTVSNSKTRSCTTADGKTIAFTNATYSGAASGEPDLSGPITLQIRSTINTTDGFGVLDGTLKIAVSGGTTIAHLNAVYDHGSLAGLASGHAQRPHVALLGNLSAGFSSSGGFTSGKIGGGTSGGSAVELGAGKCAPPKPEKPTSETSEAHGSISALSSSSITVGGLTCAIPAGLGARASTFKVGDRVEIRCSLAAGVNTLVKINAKK